MNEFGLMKEISVAVPCPLFTPLTYSHPTDLPAGVRVLVPLGRRSVIGVVVSRVEPPLEKPESSPSLQLKPITTVVDEQPIFSPTLLAMGQWLSNYYRQPLGEVFKAMLPAGKKKSSKGSKRISWRTLPAPALPNGEGHSLEESNFQTTTPTLTLEQASAVEEIRSKGWGTQSGEQKPFVLHGVTGSGKTEVYLQLIASLHQEVKPGEPKPQVLILVPEISLTPQMTMVFRQRFPGQTAVVHSGLKDKDRWEQLSAIRSGQASILIGPRSAVFAPFHNLRLIVVDEEHDGSYKQASKPPYHGRDMAILRAKLEKAVVVLGSATPSLETFHNGQSGRYHVIRLTKRVHQQALPSVEAIPHMGRRRGLELSSSSYRASKEHTAIEEMALDPLEVFSPEVIEAIGTTLSNGEQAMVIVNRRGFAPFLLDTTTKEVLTCPHCSISLTFHSKRGMARCHYCEYQESIASLTGKRGEESHVCAVGSGSQKVELLLQKLFPQAVIVRCDSDSVGTGDKLSTILHDFREKKIDLLVGTQLLAKGHDFPNVTLIALLEIDSMLHLPDFRAGERTFQLLVQAAGRAGRAEKPGRVLLQTLLQENRIIQAALHHNYLEFAGQELAFRRRFNYPPFSKMAVLEFSGDKEVQLESFASAISAWLRELVVHQAPLMRELRLLGPGVPAIARVRRHYRRTLLIQSSSAQHLHRFLSIFQQRFPRPPTGIRQFLDVDPQNLL